MINEFDFKITHIKSKENKVADALSRSLQVADMATMSTFETDINVRIKEALLLDDHYQHVKEFLQMELQGLVSKNYPLIDEGLLLFKNKKCVNNVADLRRLIMDEFHKIPSSSHLGYHKMIKTMKKIFYWLGLKGVANYIAKYPK